MKLAIVALCAACAGARPQTVPFTLAADQTIILDAKLNDADAVRLMLHTANRDVRITEAAAKRATSVRFTGEAAVGSWGGGGTSRQSTGNRLRIGPWERSGLTVWEDELSGADSDGKLGLDFFAGGIVELDFDRRVLAVHRRLPHVATYTRLQLEDDDGELFVSARCLVGTEAHDGKFLLHSGYAGGILLADAFAARAGLDGKIAITRSSALSDSFGNRIEVREGVLPGFELGGARLADVPVGFFSGGADRQKLNVVGTKVLTRFHLIFDLAHKALYIRPRAA